MDNYLETCELEIMKKLLIPEIILLHLPMVYRIGRFWGDQESVAYRIKKLITIYYET